MTDPARTVTELARELGVSARTLRFYEDKGLIAPLRDGGARAYSQRDRARMILILRGKRLGFSLRDIRDFLELYDADPTGAEQLRHLLRGVAARLARLEDQRAALDHSVTELRLIQTQAEAALAAAAPQRRRAAG